MPLAYIGLGVVIFFGLAYWTYGRFLERRLGLDDARPCPATVLRDGADYIPITRFPLLAQHFSAISAAGPIVGPILGGLLFGWLPTIAWIVVGAVFVGAAHDFASLVGSVRHRARSVAEILREHVGAPAYVLFLAFIWLALLLVIINFADVTAKAFVRGSLEIGGATVVPGPAVASSSMMYLALAAAMGILVTRFRLSFKLVGAIGAVLLFALIKFGGYLPLQMPSTLSPAAALRGWVAIILVYCFVASVAPLWLFLQPRGFLGGILLYVFLFVGLAGLFLGGHHAAAPAFEGWRAQNGLPLVPILFVTVACGACSGFHGLVCSGTTSKQIAKESHARSIGYGGMLLEGLVAVIALATIMIVAPGTAPRAPDGSPDVNAVFATGIARFAEAVGIPVALGLQFGFLALATFIYDTLDVCTRLGRYLLQELSQEIFSYKLDRYTATALTLIIPAAFLFGGIDYQTAWRIFGASNQLLAALTLLGISIWLRRRGRKPLYIVLPMVFLMVMTLSALFLAATNPANPALLRALSAALIALGVSIILMSMRSFLSPIPLREEVSAEATASS